MLNNGTQAVVLEPPPKPKTSRNIYLMLVLCCLWGFSDSIWTGTIIVSWVQLLAGGEDAKHSNSKVGYVEATQGLAMLLTALPVLRCGQIFKTSGHSCRKHWLFHCHPAHFGGGVKSLLVVHRQTIPVDTHLHGVLGHRARDLQWTKSSIVCG